MDTQLISLAIYVGVMLSWMAVATVADSISRHFSEDKVGLEPFWILVGIVWPFGLLCLVVLALQCICDYACLLIINHRIRRNIVEPTSKIRLAIARRFALGFVIYSPGLNGFCVEISLGMFLLRLWSRGNRWFGYSNYWKENQ
jgi:hypothetical protein